MQRFLIVFLALTTAAGGWFAWQYRAQIADKDRQIALLAAERDTARAAAQAALADTDPLRENIERLTKERDRLQAQAQSAPPGPPQPPGMMPGGPRPGFGPMGAMAKTEEGRKFIRAQVATRVNRNYAELSRRLKLSPQDSGVLMGLLADRQAALNIARASSSGNSAELASQTAAIQAEFDEKLRATLGDQGFDQYSEYEETVQDRAAVGQLEEQFSAAGVQLEPAQKESLIQLMNQERKNSPENPFDPSKSDPSSVLNLVKDDAVFNNWVQSQQDYQNRVLKAASGTLSPDQLATLQQSLQQRSEQERNMLQMARTTGTLPPPPTGGR